MFPMISCASRKLEELQLEPCVEVAQHFCICNVRRYPIDRMERQVSWRLNFRVLPARRGSTVVVS